MITLAQELENLKDDINIKKRNIMTAKKTVGKKQTSTWLVFLITAVISIISFYLSLKVFAPPSFGDIASERSQIIEIDKQLYEVLLKVDIKNVDSYDVLQKEDLALKTREKDADNLYNSIPDRAVIKKGFGSSSMVPVGKYKQVVKLRETNTRDRKLWLTKIQNIVQERAALIKNNQVESLWKKRIPLMEIIDDQEEKKSQYNRTSSGKINNISENFFLVLGLLSFIIALINFGAGLEEIGL